MLFGMRRRHRHIYTIMTFNYIPSDKSKTVYPDITDSRVMGFYHSFREAIRAVKENRYDICETIYQYAVVEEVHEGLYSFSMNRWFFKYNKDTHTYQPIKEPKDFKMMYGLTIG